MLKIAVCDDEPGICLQLQGALAEILDRQKALHNIDLFDSAEALCRKLNTGMQYDLIFLDIGFANSEINGVQAGHHIRNVHRNNSISIVFISWEDGYAMDLFDLRPLHFLIKPLMHEKIEQTVNTYLEIIGFSPLVFTYKKGPETFSAQIKNIVYLESADRKIVIHFSGGARDDFYGSLKELYHSQLKERDFLFIHASYLVNYDYVASVKYDRVLINGSPSSLPISQSRSSEVRETHLAIMKRRRLV